MEFGALQCSPSPNCEVCPLTLSCIAYGDSTVKAFPVKEKKIKVKDRYFNFIVIGDADSFYIQKRAAKDIWQNLYQFPLNESEKEVSSPFDLKDSILSNAVFLRVSEQFKHLLSHQRIYAKFWEFSLTEMPSVKGLKKIKKSDIQKFAVPRLIQKYLESVKN